MFSCINIYQLGTVRHSHFRAMGVLNVNSVTLFTAPPVGFCATMDTNYRLGCQQSHVERTDKDVQTLKASPVFVSETLFESNVYKVKVYTTI